MADSFGGRFTHTPASRRRPGDRGIGIVDLGDGQPFNVAITVVSVEPNDAVLADRLERTRKPDEPSTERGHRGDSEGEPHDPRAGPHYPGSRSLLESLGRVRKGSEKTPGT